MWSTRLVLATFAASLISPQQLFKRLNHPRWTCGNARALTVQFFTPTKNGLDCQPKVLQALSVVPSLPDIPFRPSSGGSTYQPTPGMHDFSYDTPIGALRNMTQVPDFARDWYAGNTAGGSVQAEVCGMYMEWIHLTQNSRGGFFFGTDPSYGGNPTARNWQAPSYSFYDNARYVALSRIFGAGFIPIGCH